MASIKIVIDESDWWWIILISIPIALLGGLAGQAGKETAQNLYEKRRR